MKRIINIFLVTFIVLSFLVSAHGEENFAQAEELIKSKVACDDLTDEQLELIGDYYMEQIHPGEAHEYMDKMMEEKVQKLSSKPILTWRLTFIVVNMKS